MSVFDTPSVGGSRPGHREKQAAYLVDHYLSQGYTDDELLDELGRLDHPHGLSLRDRRLALEESGRWRAAHGESPPVAPRYQTRAARAKRSRDRDLHVREAHRLRATGLSQAQIATRMGNAKRSVQRWLQETPEPE